VTPTVAEVAAEPAPRPAARRAARPPAEPPAPTPPPPTPPPPLIPVDPLLGPLPESQEQAPLSPAFGLPLYRALLQNPPRVDPYLGALPPADPTDRQLTPLGLVLPTLAQKSPAPTPAANGINGTNGTPAPNGANGTNGAGRAAADLRAGRERARRNRPRAERPDVPLNGHTVDPDDDLDSPDASSPEPSPRPARPRRRPAVIDLTRDDDRRSPFG